MINKHNKNFINEKNKRIGHLNIIDFDMSEVEMKDEINYNKSIHNDFSINKNFKDLDKNINDITIYENKNFLEKKCMSPDLYVDQVEIFSENDNQKI